MNAPSCLRLQAALVLAGVVGLVVGNVMAPAQPESAGAWMSCYGAILGLAPQDLPGHAEWVEELTAVVADPEHLAALGVEGATRGEKVTLTNHENGYWTIQLPGHERKFTIPLAYLVRFGVVPDRDMSAEKVPETITGRVVAPEVLAQYEFVSAARARRFTLEFADGGWWLSLEPGGERRRVPF